MSKTMFSTIATLFTVSILSGCALAVPAASSNSTRASLRLRDAISVQTGPLTFETYEGLEGSMPTWSTVQAEGLDLIDPMAEAIVQFSGRGFQQTYYNQQLIGGSNYIMSFYQILNKIGRAHV